MYLNQWGNSLKIRHPYLRTHFMWLILVMLCVLICAFTLSDNVYRMDLASEIEVIEPVDVQQICNDKKVYTVDVSNQKPGAHTLMFYSVHQEVEVFDGEQVIYKRNRCNSMFSHTTGAVYNLVSINEGTTAFKITIRDIYPSTKSEDIIFYYGNGMDIVQQLVKSSLLGLFAGAMIIAVGICLLVFWGYNRKDIVEHVDVLHLGLFSIIFGIYSLGESQAATIWLENRAACSYIQFTLLMSLPIPFLIFTRNFLQTKDRFIYKAIFVYEFVQVAGCQLMQFADLADLKETAILTHISIVLDMIYMFYSIISLFRINLRSRRAMINLIGFLILIVAMSIDMINYYTSVQYSEGFAKIGFLVFIILLGAETARNSISKTNENKKISIYREMATKDILSGCYNRNAFEEDLRETVLDEKTSVVMFDLNNLKKCNDNLGHSIGDMYIMDAAKIIHSIFKHYGKLYRIGGDEFCLVSKSLNEKRFEQLREKLQNEVDFYDNKGTGIIMGIASGYSDYMPGVDYSFDTLLDRADERMYENKKKLKAKS